MPKFKHDTVNGLLRYTLLFLLTGLTAFGAWAQINFTANDTIIPYDGYFRAGSNLGEYSGFTDEQLGDLAAGNEALHVDGVGVRALRPALYEDFVENFGYDSRISTYQHYASIGLKDNTVIIGFPSEEHRDPTQHCPGIESTLFRNMYEDIWDNGENGTPVNEENYYAAYVYKLVTRYKDYVRFWEIWNEPGFDYTMNRGWLRPGDEGNWWDNNPDPCDYKLRAPIYHYVRLLRISYEVIKHLDPEAYVAVSGVGYPSFLDAILRNTDNPFGGFVSEDYPLGGGAYFDVMGFHFYPHFDGSLREWNESRQDWDYYRHSDAAADGMLTQKDTFQYVLHQYGYDGQTFPAKEWIITECNLPRKAFGDFIGSDAAQRHFMVKAIVQAMKNDIRQLHIYKLGEDTNYDRATFEFDLMGFYQQLSRKDLYFNELTDGAVAHHSTADLLFAKQYDPVRTAALQLPAQVDGGAFRDSGGNYTYVLWARTSMDQSEEASAVYSFPLSLNVDSLQKKKWDYTQSHFREMIAGSDIPLTGEPVFLSEMMFTSNAMSGCAPFSVQFDDHAPAGAASWSWSFEGGSPASSTLAEPSVIFDQPGIYNVQLEVKDANGNILVNQQDEIVVREAPVVNFNASVSGPLVQFSNLSGNDNEGFVWDFGDGQTSTAPNPTHLYLESGTYTVRLTGGNDCQTVLHEETLSITVPTRSKLDFTANDSLIAYDGHFRPGVNLKFYSAWTDEGLADIAAGNIETDIEGVGAKAVRTLLPESFLTGWTYDIRESAFNHYVNLDLSDNTVVLGFPSANSIDTTEYCPGQRSELFRDLYLDIWDDGSDGTPINELNPYADYVYNTVLVYRDYVQFWQVLNAPGLDATGETGWLPPGEPNNWWDNDPAPCDL
ncbi:MAG: PKD domain-containing protein, partial [Bacteroidota bacterium]